MRRLVLAGGVLAAALGARAGAALRPQPEERGLVAAPQQIVLDDAGLASAERAGGGWPIRGMVVADAS